MTPRQVIPADALSTSDALERLGLRPAAPDNSPDRDLLADMAALADMDRDLAAAFANMNGRGVRRVGTAAAAQQAFLDLARTSTALQNRIILTAAQTPAGALQKMLYTMEKWDDGHSGSWLDLPLSALRDALALGFGVVMPRPEPPPVWGMPPRNPDDGGQRV